MTLMDEDKESYVGEDALEDGDHVFAAMISCEAEFIWAIHEILI